MTEMKQFFEETGREGGKSRAANMTPEERSASAKRAARARWKKAAAASAKVRSAKAKAAKK
jgi:hypothetical protein